MIFSQLCWEGEFTKQTDRQVKGSTCLSDYFIKTSSQYICEHIMNNADLYRLCILCFYPHIDFTCINVFNKVNKFQNPMWEYFSYLQKPIRSPT